LRIYGPEASRFVDALSELSYWDFGFKIKTIDVDYEGTKVKRIFSGKKYDILSIPVEHSIPAVAYCFKEKDKWNIDMKKAKRLGLEEGPLLDELKTKKKIEIRGKVIKLSDVATKTPGKKIVYSGDTAPCENILKISKGADLLIHDGTFIEGPNEREYMMKRHTDVRKA